MEAKDDKLRFDARGVREHYENESIEYWKKQGIKEVVEWGRETCPHNLGEGTQYYKRVCDTCWQTKLKEWGIDGK